MNAPLINFSAEIQLFENTSISFISQEKNLEKSEDVKSLQCYLITILTHLMMTRYVNDPKNVDARNGFNVSYKGQLLKVVKNHGQPFD